MREVTNREEMLSFVVEGHTFFVEGGRVWIWDKEVDPIKELLDSDSADEGWVCVPVEVLFAAVSEIEGDPQ